MNQIRDISFAAVRRRQADFRGPAALIERDVKDPTLRKELLRSLILRGYPSTAYRQIDGDDYHYSHQPALNFAQLLQVSAISGVQQLMRTAVNTEPFGTSIVNPDPTPAKRAPKIAPIRDAVEGSGR